MSSAERGSKSAASGSSWRTDRAIGLAVIFLSYVAAIAVGLAVFQRLALDLWLSVLLADIAATLVIWVSSIIFDNATVYDPYWSVQPIVILGLLLFKVGLFDTSSVLLFLVVCIWGVRLTANWIFTFSGLNRQDWRYDMIKSKTGKLFPLASLFGIQLLPTLIVYFCILPAIVFISESDAFNYITIIGLLVSLAGLILEAVADHQMHAFKKVNRDRAMIIREGLWRHSRHPNYLGELMMWWGVFIVLLSARPDGWPLGLGALLNTALFLFISIPMAEGNMARYKTGFADYRRQTRMLLPLPKKVE